MAKLIPVPEVAAGATEVVLSEWTVEPGQSITAGNVIAVVETEKAVVEVEADQDATILRQLVSAGSAVDVGAPLALVGSASEVDSDLDAVLAELGVGVSTATPAPLRREIPEAEPPATAAPPVTVISEVVPTGSPDATLPAPGTAGATARQFVSPIARKLLADAGVSPLGIVGTGPAGRIRRRDVEPAIQEARASKSADPGREAAAVAESPTETAQSPGPWTDIPHSRLRRAIARRLTASKQEVPHFYLRRTARMDALLTLRKELNEAAPAKISVNDFLIRAIAVAHQQVPDANVMWTDDAVRRFDTVDISVAIASERGLVTPVLRGVEQRSLSAISAEVKRFVASAADGRIQQRDLEGGSITISNLGMFGVDEFSAIINPPQASILAVGAARHEPAVVDGAVVPATMTNLVLSADHRAIDGALAAQWMSELVAAIENPLRLVL